MRSVVIDPPSAHYLANKLFDLNDPALNRDGVLLLFQRMRAALQAQGDTVNTVDLLLNQQITGSKHVYFSLGMLSNLPTLLQRQDVVCKVFVIFEPPIVAPELYAALPELSRQFERVYIHNTVGEGYALVGVDVQKLRQLFWAQPYVGVLEPYWSNSTRQKRIVVINGNHKPKQRAGELYSKRIHAMADLARHDAVDLYGRGWQRWWSRTALWWPYWRHRHTLMRIYRGECASKYAVLSEYQFCLCFENMVMKSYITEKIFDCLYAGTIPLYWGAPDIAELIPPETFIDVRQFASWDALWAHIQALSPSQIQAMRAAGKAYLESPAFLRYYHAMTDIVNAV